MSCARCSRSSVPPLQGGMWGGRGGVAVVSGAAPLPPSPAGAFNLLGEAGGGAAAAASATTAAEQREVMALRRTSFGILTTCKGVGGGGTVIAKKNDNE